jgi:predicted  nucleic acid-binding Zn-ribbon protein
MIEQQKLLEFKINQTENRVRVAEQRLKNAEYQTKSIKQNFFNRCKAMEAEIDRFENRIAAIKEHPSIVDNSLVNIAYLLTNKSQIIDNAILQIRKEIKEFNKWVGF